MTALPVPPTRLLSVAEYAALGEDEHGRCELQEGRLLMSPSPTPDHGIVMVQLAIQLDRQAPDGLRVIPDIDVDLELVPPGQPGFSRRPDLVVVDQAAVHRVRREGGMLRAADAVVIVEIVSPGSRRTDHVIKRGEYADAGIPHYWVVELEPAVSLRACHLADGSGYRDPGPVTGAFAAAEPFPVHVQLDRLL